MPIFSSETVIILSTFQNGEDQDNNNLISCLVWE